MAISLSDVSFSGTELLDSLIRSSLLVLGVEMLLRFRHLERYHLIDRGDLIDVFVIDRS